jgi:hypothetical protein
MPVRRDGETMRVTTADDGLPWLRMGVILLVSVATLATALALMGQPLVCTCGVVRIWNGLIRSPENSQQISDWYTFSHIIHGMIFYAAIRFLMPGLSVARTFALALAIEVGWEVLENSPPVIERYRQQALASGYSGDSVLNSCFDLIACALGFIAAAKLPVRISIGAAVAMELFTLVMVRDNLTLNVVQIIWPIDAIGRWQEGAQE